MELKKLVENLNNKDVTVRLNSLREIMWLYESGKLPWPKKTKTVNNHIHTTYSFSPYSPTKAVYMAFIAGLTTAGIMDHDSIGGAREFIEAGKIAGIATTVGFETRVIMDGSKYMDRRYNNPDQVGVAYVACHGIPHTQIEKVASKLVSVREKRNERNKKQVERLNELIKESGVSLDFTKDVLPISEYSNGGTVTERHILYALSKKLVLRYKRGAKLIKFLEEGIKIDLNEKLKAKLMNTDDEYYEYTLLGVLKSNLVEKFFIPAKSECLTAAEFCGFVKEIGAISAYAYLGDVGDSVTGDKKAQKFEDEFLDGLVKELKTFGFNSITFMPTRNTSAQLNKLMGLCNKNGFFQICGEDVNSPSQSFVCNALKKPEYKHLITATWALIGHEKAATLCFNNRLFGEETCKTYPLLDKRIKHFYSLGKK